MGREWITKASIMRSVVRARGQGLVELSISLMLMLILLAGVIDLGRMFFIYVELMEAAQEGAAYGSIARDYEEQVSSVIIRVEERTRMSANRPIDLEGDPNVEIEVNLLDLNGSGEWCEENRVQVGVRYTTPITTPFLGAILGKQTIEIPAVIEDTILRPPCS